MEPLENEGTPLNNLDVSKGSLTAVERPKGKGACQTIAIFNQKGGVGKTVTAINLSAVLAAQGRPTLLIDLDPQGQSGLGMGLKTESLDCSVYDLLMDGGCPINKAIVPLRPNLQILPSNIDRAAAELEMARFPGKERRLKELIDKLRHRYEYVVIDCSPSVRILTLNALLASQIVIVPVTPSFFSVHCLERVTDIIDSLRESTSLDTQVYFLMTFFEKRHKEALLQKERLEATLGQHLFQTIIRKNTKLNEATRKGVPVLEYDRNCPASRDYRELAREVMLIEARTTIMETIEQEEQAHGEAGAVEREELADPVDSMEPHVTEAEEQEQTRSADSEWSPAEGIFTIPPVKRERSRPWAPLLVVLLGSVLLSSIIGVWFHRTSWVGGEGEIYPIIPIREKPALENIGETPAEAMSQPGESTLVPVPKAELDQKRVLPEPVGANLSEVEENLLPSPPAEESGARGPQTQETVEKSAGFKDLEESVPESGVASAGYTVNLASFKIKARAESYLEELREQNLQAFVWEAEVPQKGTWYRVSLGGFSTIEQAQLFAKDLEQRGFKTFVTRLPGERPQPTDQEPSPSQDQEIRRLFRS